jgi:hypothetical protein
MVLPAFLTLPLLSDCFFPSLIYRSKEAKISVLNLSLSSLRFFTLFQLIKILFSLTSLAALVDLSLLLRLPCCRGFHLLRLRVHQSCRSSFCRFRCINIVCLYLASRNVLLFSASTASFASSGNLGFPASSASFCLSCFSSRPRRAHLSHLTRLSCRIGTPVARFFFSIPSLQ